MFKTLDSLGRVKILPSGSSFTNPLAVANGGTALVQISDGELYVPTVAGAMNRLARSTKANRCLSKEATEPTSTWKSLAAILGPYYLPDTASRPTTAPRVFHFSSTGNGGVAFVNAYGGNNMVSAGGTLSDASDAVGPFTRFTTGNASGNISGCSFDVAGIGSNGDAEIAQELLYVCKFRTGSDITNVRLQIGMADVSYPANSDAQASRGINIQYSTVRVDSGWQITYGDNLVASQVVIASGVAIAASTVYTLTLRIYTNDGISFLADVTLNGTLVTISVPVFFSSSGASGARPYIAVITQTAATRFIDLQRILVVQRHADQLY